MKRILFYLLAALALWSMPNTVRSQGNLIDEVIWVVGDDAVLLSDVENYRLQMLSNRQRVDGDPYCVIPEQIAVQKLYLHQAKLDSIEVSEADVSYATEQRINRYINDMGSKEKLEEYAGKPLTAIREEWKGLVREMLMMQNMQKTLASGIKVTPVEVRNYYNRISQDSLPFIPTKVEVEIITAHPKIPLSETDEIKRRLRDFIDQVNSGEREFSTLARLYSEDTESAKRGGELGFVNKTAFVPEFAAVAFEMTDPKKISRIVETEYGFHIIQFIEKRGELVNVRHILLRPHVSETELTAATNRLDSVRSNILEGKFTFEEAAIYVSDDRETSINKGLMVNKSIDDYTGMKVTSWFELSELPTEISRLVYKMKEGDISEPFIMTNSKQKEVAAIIRLKSRVEGHKANISDDYQILLSMVEDEKIDKFLDNWVQEKIKNTYIRIKDDWRNCDFKYEGWIK